MKKKAFLTAVVLVCAMFLTGMAANQAMAAFDIHFIGYCDGFKLDVSGGQVYGNITGCQSGVVLGDIALTFNPVKGFGMALGFVNPDALGFAPATYLNFDKKTFIFYWTTGIGDPPWEGASGNWDFGPPSGPEAGLPATVPSAPE